MTIHICSPSAIAVKRRIRTCPICKTLRRFTDFDYGWWGFDLVCHTCGVRIQDDGYDIPNKANAHLNRRQARAGWAEPYDSSEAYWADYMEASER